MKVLVLGGTGMLGHKLWQVLKNRFEAYVTVRKGYSSIDRFGLFDPDHTVENVFVAEFDNIIKTFAKVRPEVVVNCIGIVKQAAEAKDPLLSIEINSLFPHRLWQFCRAAGSRLIHISTDCVFSGKKGKYLESDEADGYDLYGRTKALGEVEAEGCVTLRTSMIGRELESSYGLMEWFFNQEGKSIRGFRKAFFSGFTTGALAEIIATIISDHRDLSGIWHVASNPISKFDLLSLVKKEYGLDIRIEPDENFLSDRSLNGDRFRRAVGFSPPSWPDMIRRMREDSTPYAKIRSVYAHK